MLSRPKTIRGHYVHARRGDFAGKALIFSGLNDTQFAMGFVTRSHNAADPERAQLMGLTQPPAVRVDRRP